MFQIGKSGTTTLNSGLGTGTGGNYLCIDTSNFEILRGNGSACTASSLRFKEDINNITYGLDAVMQLRAVSFKYKPEMNSGTSTHLGFIAEEVEPIIPELVSYNNDGQIQGLDYPTVVAVLTKAFQELVGQVASTTAATTSAPELTSGEASTTVPWLATFANVSQEIRDGIHALHDIAIHVIQGALYATTGIFEKIFTKEIHTQNVYADELQTKKTTTAELCVDDVCVTREQFLKMVQTANSSSASGSGNAPMPAPEPEPTSVPEPEPTPDTSASSTPPAAESDPEPDPAPEAVQASEPAPEPLPTPTPETSPEPAPAAVPAPAVESPAEL